MIIRSIRHRGLRRFVERDDPRQLPSDFVRRIRNILAMLISASDMHSVTGPPGWNIHQLKGDRAGTWSFSVRGNWRVTFDIEQGEICNLDLEDYH
jgi:proteic killer suppression protein